MTAHDVAGNVGAAAGGGPSFADAAVPCRVCHRAYAKYTCPRCFTRYCALACYKAHGARCVEAFHGENLGDAMRGLTVEDEDRRRMTEILARHARQDVDAEEDEGSENRDEDEGECDPEGSCVLSEAALEKLTRGEDLTAADLTPAERADFERAAAAGELSHMVEPWTPWWTLPEARNIQLARDGSRLIAAVRVDAAVADAEPSLVASTRGCAPEQEQRREGSATDFPTVPPPPDDPLPPLSRLTPVKASPVLRWHLLEVLAAYTLTLRAHDGDWAADPSAAVTTLTSLSLVLAAGTKRAVRAAPTSAEASAGAGDGSLLPQTASAALHGVASRAAAAPSGVMAAMAAAAAAGVMLKDLHSVLAGGRGAVVTALADLHRVVRAAAEEAKGTSGRRPKGDDGAEAVSGRDTRARGGRGGGREGDAELRRGALSRLERKVYFFLCWANAMTDGPAECERGGKRDRTCRGDEVVANQGMIEQVVTDRDGREVWSLMDDGKEEVKGDAEGVFGILHRRIEREMRTFAEGRAHQHQSHQQALGGVEGSGGNHGGRIFRGEQPRGQRQLVTEL